MTAIVSPVCMVLLAGAAATATGLRWRRLMAAMLRAEQPDPRFDHLGQRVKAFAVYVLGQARLLRWPYAGVLHALIFWGFVVLLTAIAQAIIEALWQGFRFNDIPGAWVIAFLQDIFCIAALTGVVLALVNRLVVNPTRFRASHRGDAVLILAWIGTLLIFMELNYATLIAQGRPAWALAADRPVASALSQLFTPLGSGSNVLTGLHGFFFWGHLILVFSFLVYLGYSKHLHIITAAPNVFFKSTTPKGALPGARHRGGDECRERGRPALRPGDAAALQLEGHARPVHVHRVRSLPDPLPRVQHRQATVTEDADHRPSRPSLRGPRRWHPRPPGTTRTSSRAPTSRARRSRAPR